MSQWASLAPEGMDVSRTKTLLCFPDAACELKACSARHTACPAPDTGSRAFAATRAGRLLVWLPDPDSWEQSSWETHSCAPFASSCRKPNSKASESGDGPVPSSRVSPRGFMHLYVGNVGAGKGLEPEQGSGTLDKVGGCCQGRLSRTARRPHRALWEGYGPRRVGHRLCLQR